MRLSDSHVLSCHLHLPVRRGHSCPRTVALFLHHVLLFDLAFKQPPSLQSTDEYLLSHRVRAGCVSLFASQEETSIARKVGQSIARGDRRWLIRVYLGRDHETKKRKYHNRTIHGPMREARAYLTRKLRERNLGRDLEGAKITLNKYLHRWLEIAVKPRVREKTCQDYDGMLRRYIQPSLGERVLAAMRPMDVQTTYQKMIEPGLFARTVRYTHAVLRSAIQQALQWRLLLENPVDAVKIPQRPRGEMRSLTVEQAQTFLLAALATPHGPVLAVALTTGIDRVSIWV